MTASDINLRYLKATDTDLAEISARLNTADWEASIKDFSPGALRDFLQDPNHFYLLALIGQEIVGAVHGYVYPHPTGVKYMWIDEVDTMEGHRRKGVATTMLKDVFRLAKEYGCDEAWLGTEFERPGAMALYEGLEPSEREDGPTYSWKVN